jgi:hypothetical protein
MQEKYLSWHRARRSEAGGNCVEVALATDCQAIGVRDSKARGAGPILELTHQEWTAFLDSIRTS